MNRTADAGYRAARSGPPGVVSPTGSTHPISPHPDHAGLAGGSSALAPDAGTAMNAQLGADAQYAFRPDDRGVVVVGQLHQLQPEVGGKARRL